MTEILGILAPFTSQRTAHEEYNGPYPGPVINAKLLDVGYIYLFACFFSLPRLSPMIDGIFFQICPTHLIKAPFENLCIIFSCCAGDIAIKYADSPPILTIRFL